METINEILEVLLKKYRYSDRFSISLKYYFEAKMSLLLKNKIISDFQKKDILKLWINNFCCNVDTVVEKSNSKYTFVEYELDRKKIVYYVGKEANINKDCIDIKENVRTTQYIYKIFSILEYVTNYNIKEIDKNYLKIYKLINSNIAYKYLNYAPKVEKAKLYFRCSNMFYDICTFDSVLSVSKNYMDIITEYIIGYKKLYNIFINNNFNFIFNDQNNKKIFDYLLYIYDEVDYENFILFNEKIIELILEKIANNINSLTPLSVYDKEYFKNVLNDIEKKLPYTIHNEKKYCISNEKIKIIRKKAEI